jgi:hypothetical protein
MPFLNLNMILWIGGWLLAATLNQVASVWMHDWLETDHFDPQGVTPCRLPRAVLA